MRRRVLIIGIGAGSPDLLTQQAISALNEVDAFLVADKGDDKDELVAVRRAICERHIAPTHSYRFVALPDPDRRPDAQRGTAAYRDGVREWHAARARLWAQHVAGLPDGETVGFLVWGDPAFYDSTIRVVDAIRGHLDLDVRVIPGISAIQVLAAEHGVVLHAVGEPVHVTTGRRLVAEWEAARAAGVELGTVVVMLDGHLACRGLVDSEPDLMIRWGAYVGMPQQELRAGRLAEVIEEIIALRAELRERHGWVMDVYALSRE